jgi:NADH-quinone oxidoreductase subunit F
MKRPTQEFVASTLATAAGLAVLVAAAVLTTDSIAASRRLQSDRARTDALEEKAREDAAFSEQLHVLCEQLRDATLRHQSRKDFLSPTLVIAAVILVVSSQWLVTRRDLASGTSWLPKKRYARPPSDAAEPSGAAPHETPSAPDVQAATGSSTAPKAVARPSRRGTHHREARAPQAIGGLPTHTEDVDPSFIDEIIAGQGRGRQAAIPILQAIQSHYGYLPEAALWRVCEQTEITPAQLVGVATFYSQFRRTPVGRHLVKVCHGTACHVAGAPRITDQLRRYLRIAPGQDTDPNRGFTIEQVACLGCCILAPVVQIDDRVHGHLRCDTALDLLSDCDAPKANGKRPRPAMAEVASGGMAAVGEIRIGMGSCCMANGSDQVHDALEDALASIGIRAAVKRVGCVGMCHQTPLIEVDMPDQAAARYACTRPEHARAIIRHHFKPRGLARRVQTTVSIVLDHLRDGAGRHAVRQQGIELHDPPVAAFLGRQKHIATEHCGCIDPTDLDEYLRHDGFQALRRCQEGLTPDEVIEQIRQSRLRGRGGAGFPTATKWAEVRRARGDGKYIVCNGDEGDPGAFMDRMLMESYPYRIIEGVAIAAYATGTTKGFFYIRREYLLAAQRIAEALRQCERRGLLGANIFGRGRGLRLRVVEGAGAFVCGEETALIATLEGRRGMPRLRPPFPSQAGLWDRPTLVNNVETFAVVPWILRHGPAAFAAVGTPTSAGTKVFALTGKINRGGLIEVPMGVTIREIVEEIGGGIKQDSSAGDGQHKFKAVQIGGPSGGCVPAELADTPVDYEALAGVGAIMGSGGLVVLDESDCMVDIARYFLTFTQGQSCGRCTQCRIGTRRMLEILDRLCAGQGRGDDLQKLEHLARMGGQGSLCGLGKTAPNPVLTTLRYFRQEYEAHLQGRCPAGKCKALIAYSVSEACTGCTICAQHCPADAIAMRPYERHEIDSEQCTRCDTCRVKCPESAIRIV